MRIALSLLPLLLLTVCLAAEELPVLREHEPYRQQATLTNHHDRAVRITHLDASCTCMTLELAGTFLLPGASTTVTFEADNSMLSGDLRRRIWAYVSDPDYEPFELVFNWRVRPLVFVDALPPDATPEALQQRPEKAWRDIYRYLAASHPEATSQLRKVLRIGTVSEETPAGGFRIAEIVYEGGIWQFSQRQLDERHVLLIARGVQGEEPTAEGEYHETVRLRTNHPLKNEIELFFETTISSEPVALQNR